MNVTSHVVSCLLQVSFMWCCPIPLSGQSGRWAF